MVLAVWSVAAKVDEACLVGVERELVPSKTLAQSGQNPRGILEIRERHYGIVGETDKGTFPLQTWFHHVLEPLIQHMMEVDIREAGRHHPTLRGAFGRMAQVHPVPLPRSTTPAELMALANDGPTSAAPATQKAKASA
jgi:hypothetical protein